MLNIINLKLNNNNNNISTHRILSKSNQIKHFSPAIKEWNNSIYAFNKNSLNLIPLTNKIIIKLVKSYFNLYNGKLESIINHIRIRTRSRRLSSHRIYISKGEFKHTNEKVFVNIYIYNRQKYNYLYGIKKRIKNLFKRKFFLKRKIKIIRIKAFLLIEKIRKNRIIVLKNKKWEFIIKYYFKKYLKKSLKRQMLFFYYKKLLLLNKFKFKYTYLNKITNLIKKISNKNIELNIINLKYFYLNSDIFTESIINKITKERKRLYKILKRSVQKVKIEDKNWMESFENNSDKNKLNIHNFIGETKIKSYLLDWTNEKDPFDNLLNGIFSSKTEDNLKNTVLDSIKNKTITGVRLEAAGRLSKRHTASRSISKLRYKGSLKNIDSSYKGLSSVILRGNTKANIQYTNLNSIARIGSFGIKGWISNN